MADTDTKAFNISTLTILKIVIIGLVLWFLYNILDVLAMLFVSFIIASSIGPLVDRFELWKLPRVASVVILYVILFGVFSLLLILLVPAVIDEIGQLATKIPDLYSSFSHWLFTVPGFPEKNEAVSTLQNSLETISSSLSQVTSGIFNTLSSVFGGVASFLTVLVLTFYMTVEKQGMRKFVSSVVPPKYQPYFVQLLNKIQEKLGSWLRGQLLLSLIIGVTVYVGLLLLGVKYALLLGLLAGAFEIIPFIGPVLAAIPAVFFAATESPLKALLVVVLYIVIQQLENNIVVPKVMAKTVGLNPIVILVAVLIGARVGGVVGIILAVPVAAIIAIFLRDIFEERRMRSNKLEAGP